MLAGCLHVSLAIGGWEEEAEDEGEEEEKDEEEGQREEEDVVHWGPIPHEMIRTLQDDSANSARSSCHQPLGAEPCG